MANLHFYGQRSVAIKLYHSLSSKERKDRGVSTLIAMMAFVLIFMLAMTYSYYLIQNSNNYALALKEETEFKMQQSDETLYATTIITHNINVSNPTALPINITQIWNSDHTLVSTNQPLAPYSSILINNLTSLDGHFTLITERGNLFYSMPGFESSRNSTALGGHWEVSFWARNASGPYYRGHSIWRQLDFSRSYDNSSWDVNYLTSFGFNASTLILPTKNLVSVYVGVFDPYFQRYASQAVVSINSSTSYQNTWTVNSPTMVFFNNLNTSAIYELKVQYSTNTTTTDYRIITIEVINAEFFQYNSTPIRYTPIVTTYLNDPNVLIDQNAFDNVTVTGDGFTLPNGTIEFQNNDTGSWVTFCNITLDNGNAASSLFSRNATGHYFFKAIYSGDSNYYSAESAIEELLVGYIPTVTTLLNATTITLGDYVFDSVTVVNASGPAMPTGTVQFQYKFENGAWENHGIPVTLTGSGLAESMPFHPDKAGTWYFQAVYSGDDNYLDFVSGLTADETLTVNKAGTTITTKLNATTITFGQTIHDNATVIGLGGIFPVPTGTVQFQCNDTGSWVTFATKSLDSNGNATLVNFIANHTGTFFFRAVYGGDTNYLNHTSDIESFSVNKYKPIIPAPTLRKSGNNLIASVIVPGVLDVVPIGNVLFQYSFNGGVWTNFPGGNRTLSLGIATDTVPLNSLSNGNYAVRAIYYGDSNYLNSTSANATFTKP